MNMPDLIEVRRDVMMGKPCLKGTRIPVYIVLEKLAAGETPDDIVAAYPQITKKHVQAALQYAANIAAEEVILAGA